MPSASARITIAIIGRGVRRGGTAVDAATLDAAEAAGRRIAQRGAVLVTGGTTGVMESASKGAHEAGGIVVGLLPGRDPRDANEFVDIALPTGLGRARNLLDARAASALVMIGGGVGTLNELTFAYAEGKPIVILEGSGGWADRIRPVLYERKYLDDRRTAEIRFAPTPEAAADLAIELAHAYLDAPPTEGPPV